MVTRKASPKILVLLHQEHSTPGRVGRLLGALGAELDIRRHSLDEPLPEHLADHDGVVVFGGPMSANDDCAWICRQIGWLTTPLKEDKPFLGICLGAQMLTRALGARVFTYPDQRAEIGYTTIRPTASADRLCAAPFPRQVYQWHRDGFDLPTGAELLAEGGETFPVQAYRYGGKAVALQFHPEVTYQMICRWTVRGHERLSLPGAQPRQSHLDGWYRFDAAVERWLGAFLPQWLDGRLPRPVAAAPARQEALEFA
ncbi:MAG TPA: glutamine amidotransferase [Roseiarcus sp.]|nr:glutamine amidotransferase [Roseiarcus sp.]